MSASCTKNNPKSKRGLNAESDVVCEGLAMRDHTYFGSLKCYCSVKALLVPDEHSVEQNGFKLQLIHALDIS